MAARREAPHDLAPDELSATDGEDLHPRMIDGRPAAGKGYPGIPALLASSGLLTERL
jgi:hypothetical protein